VRAFLREGLYQALCVIQPDLSGDRIAAVRMLSAATRFIMRRICARGKAPFEISSLKPRYLIISERNPANVSLSRRKMES
jgi:hypothetical protein